MIGTLITLVIWIIVVGLLLWLVQYVATAIPLPEPFPRVINIIIVVIGVLFLIYIIASLFGAVEPLRPLRY